MDEMNTIIRQIEAWLDQGEIAGASLIIRKNGNIIMDGHFGYADLDRKIPVTRHSIYRMMSMSKVITAVGVMKLVEDGKISLEDPVSKYIPAFAQPRVVQDERYVYDPKMSKLRMAALVAGFRLDRVKTVPAEREITIRDLLTHSSGLEQGVAGFIASLKNHNVNESLAEEIQKYAAYPLDFQPGTATSYSPIAGFDTLLRICEIVSGKRADIYLKESIFDPLEMKDTAFSMSEEQQKRLVHVYKKNDRTLKDVTGTQEDMDGMLHRGEHMISGSGGIYATCQDYERFAHILCDEGVLGKERILKPETVRLIRSEGAISHLEPEPGMVWGLGVRIRQRPELTGGNATPGTYGWSGAFGTHFFISPEDQLDAVWCTNRTDAGGSGFPISKKIEQLVFEQASDLEGTNHEESFFTGNAGI